MTEPIPLPSTEVRQILLNLLFERGRGGRRARARGLRRDAVGRPSLEVRVENDGIGLNA